MSLYHLYLTTTQRLESMNFHQMALFTIVVVALGIFWLRGYGSRAKY
jgi:hypothetical protein